jgi:hypothetical protein
MITEVLTNMPWSYLAKFFLNEPQYNTMQNYSITIHIRGIKRTTYLEGGGGTLRSEF